MKARGGNARGVAVIDEKTSERELDALNAAGIRGVRINRATTGTSDSSIAVVRRRELEVFTAK